MKKIVLGLFLLYCNPILSQTLPNVDEIKLDKVSDFKSSEPIVLQTVNYLLSTPFDANNKSRSSALSFIIKWTSGTSDYTFLLDNITRKVSKGNDDVLGIYLTCLTKYTLENKGLAKDPKLIQLNSVKMLLAYCENPKNNFKLTKQLKKLLNANQKGELDKEL